MKRGIDYFPLDVALDEKFELIEAQFGLTGFAVLVKLLQKIYGSEGYYVEWTNEIALLFAMKIGANGNAVSDIVGAAVKRGIFDATLYEKYQILTSKGIQKRYFEAVSRRKNVEVKGAYLLIDVTVFSKNVNILGENADIFRENADISQQSKGKESRVKESKVSVCSARAREDTTGLEKFIEKWGINAIGMDNYSAGQAAGMDWAAISDRVEKSAFLRQQKSLAFYIRHGREIVEGYYDDFAKPVARGNAPPTDLQSIFTAEKLAEYDRLAGKHGGRA